MSTAKKVYTVKGSEDGILAVASNIKAAYGVAARYGDGSPSMSYTQVVRELKIHGLVYFENGWTSVEIEMFYLKSK